MKKIYIIADWASDSLTCAEVKIAINGYLKNQSPSSLLDITFITSTSSSIHTSYLINQIVEDIERFGQPLETIIFQNTDPRLYANTNIIKAEGATPLIVKLKSGLNILGPNSSHSYSLIKNRINEIFTYTGLNEKGQFHSRDLYARLSAHLADYMDDELELDEIGIDIIPDLQGYYIGHIDNFGNIKTTITLEDFKGKYEYGDKIKLKINSTEKIVKYVPNLFGGKANELVIYPGSSGPKNNPYLEITIWRHFSISNQITTGINEFNLPKPGDIITIIR